MADKAKPLSVFARTEPAPHTPGDNSDLDEGRITAVGVGLRLGEIAALDGIAQAHDLTRNQLARWALRYFLVQYRAGKINLAGAVKPPKPGKNTLDLPE